MTVRCSICSQVFATPSLWAGHIDSNHVRCTHRGCTLVFGDAQALEKHRKDHQIPSRFVPSRDRISDRTRSRTDQVRGPYGRPFHSDNRFNVANASIFDPRSGHNPSHNITRQPQAANNIRTTTMTSVLTGRPVTWSVIPASQHETAIQQLRERALPKEVLLQRGYTPGSEGERRDFDFSFAPQASLYQPRLPAVALDCEMVGCRDEQGKDHSVLARLSVIDYLTGAVIIDKLVQPSRQVTDWRTRYSGITRGMMNAANRSGQALQGINEAQAELWKYVDQDTIIVGQSLKNDFDALHMIHFRVVDSGVLTGQAIGIGLNTLVGLKIACLELLDIRIQQGKSGHDSVEDSLAAREVVLFCVNEDSKDKLEKWARVRRETHEIAEAKRAIKLAQERAERIKLKDQSISWTRECWQQKSTKWQLQHPNVCLPVHEIPVNLAERLREAMEKQYEMLIARSEARWESTITQSKELLEELPHPKIFGYTWRLPPATGSSFEEEAGQTIEEELSDDDLLGLDSPHNILGASQQVQINNTLSEEEITLLDDLLDESEVSLLMEPMLPSSPNAQMSFLT